MKCYKVARSTGGVYRSATNCGQITYYIIGETTVRDNQGPLGVFDTIKNAMKFIEDETTLRILHILECEAELSSETIMWYINVTNGNIYDTVGWGDMPDGTLYADTVTPIRLVEGA